MLTDRTHEYYWAEASLDWEDAILEWEETNKLETQARWRCGDIAVALRPRHGEGIEETLKAFADAVSD
jgi:hypothetical protein